MNAIRTKKRKVAELDLLPIMNLFSILIPFLLAVVSFQKIALVEVELPPASLDAPLAPEGSDLNLSAAILPDRLQVVASHGSLPPILVQERWKVQCHGESELRSSPAGTESERAQALHCADGSTARTQDIEEIQLVAVDSQGHPIRALYHPSLGYLERPEGGFFGNDTRPNAGAMVVAEGKTLYWDPRENHALEVRDLDAYTALGRMLSRVATRHADAPDAGKLSVLADDNVVADKVVHVMDAARDNGFPTLSLAKLGA